MDIHSLTSPPTIAAPGEVARTLLAALTGRDHATVRSLLSPDVWLRALLPRKVAEAHSADEAAALLDDWLGPPDAGEVLEAAHHSIHGREHLRYRLVLRPEWDPATWHEIEQCGYVRVAEGRVTRMDLVCTGYWPCAAPSPRDSRHRSASRG